MHSVTTTSSSIFHPIFQDQDSLVHKEQILGKRQKGLQANLANLLKEKKKEERAIGRIITKQNSSSQGNQEVEPQLLNEAEKKMHKINKFFAFEIQLRQALHMCAMMRMKQKIIAKMTLKGIEANSSTKSIADQKEPPEERSLSPINSIRSLAGCKFHDPISYAGSFPFRQSLFHPLDFLAPSLSIEPKNNQKNSKSS